MSASGLSGPLVSVFSDLCAGMLRVNAVTFKLL